MAWTIQAQNSMSVSGRAFACMKAVGCMTNISMSVLYSRRLGTVPLRPEPAHREVEPKAGDVAVEGGTGDAGAADDLGNGAAAKCRAEATHVVRQTAQRPGESVMGLGVVLGRAVLTMPGGQTVGLRQHTTQRLGAARNGRIQRQNRATLCAALAVMTDGDARGLVAKDDVGESADGATAGVETRQPADQVDQQVLAEIVEIGGRQHQL